MSKIQITITHTIDRTTSVHDDKAIRCGKDCFHCSRQYRECDLFPFSKREYHQSDNAWSPCQACIDAERKADEDEAFITAQDSTMGGLIEDLTDAIQDKDELVKALEKIYSKIGSDGWAKLNIADIEQILAKHKEMKG